MCSAKCCLGTAFVLGLIAVALCALALDQPFWYNARYNIVGTNGQAGVAYGVQEYGAGYVTNKDLELWKSADGWSWADFNGKINSAVGKNIEDCAKAAENGLAWGVLGLLATAPAALICIMTCFCSSMGCMGKFMNFIAIGCLGFATFAWVISPAVLAGECEDANKADLTNVALAYASTQGTTLTVSDTELTVGWALITQLIALLLVFIALICYVIFFLKFSSKTDQPQGTTQTTMKGQQSNQTVGQA